ncbi:hypothetical protein G9A89_021075 [Geosiphon pyriformis]|nr:hypothetical protein G9A89_021075 [Geosiphon pyriformis]
MSLQQLLSGGSDCGQNNSMAGLRKQFSQDESLKKDKFLHNPAGEGSSRGSFRMTSSIGLLQKDEFEEFFAGSDQANPTKSFQFNQMGKELNEIQGHKKLDWVNEFQNRSQSTPFISLPISEYDHFDKIFEQGRNGENWVQGFSESQNVSPNRDGEMLPEERAAFETAFDEAKRGVEWQTEFIHQSGSWVKESQKELDSVVISNATKTKLAITAGALLDVVEGETNPKFQNSDFLKLMKNFRDQKMVIERNKVVEQKVPVSPIWAPEFNLQQKSSWASEFNEQRSMNFNPLISSTDNGWKSEFLMTLGSTGVEDFSKSAMDFERESYNKELEKKWNEYAIRENFLPLPDLSELKEFDRKLGPTTQGEVVKHQFNSLNYAQEFTRIDQAAESQERREWNDMQNDWEKYEPHNTGYITSFHDYDNYIFQSKNPCFDIGNQIINQNIYQGHLGESILALEATVQIDSQNASAWYQLGIRQQENEQETQAILALRKAVSVDPTLSDAWLALAVSYSNKDLLAHLYDALESWVKTHDRYFQLLVQERSESNLSSRHRLLTNALLEAAISNPGKNLDPDVQIGLGVLFNVGKEYHKAADCFQAALTMRPNDFLLWNKLGATLVNAGEYEKAINAYFNVLEINPAYIRARYNLALSCQSLKLYKEAADHLLAALTLQNEISLQKGWNDAEVSKPFMNRITTNLWDSLKVCCESMQREDLVAKCVGLDLEAFRSDFDF